MAAALSEKKKITRAETIEIRLLGGSEVSALAGNGLTRSFLESKLMDVINKSFRTGFVQHERRTEQLVADLIVPNSMTIKEELNRDLERILNENLNKLALNHRIYCKINSKNDRNFSIQMKFRKYSFDGNNIGKSNDGNIFFVVTRHKVLGELLYNNY